MVRFREPDSKAPEGAPRFPILPGANRPPRQGHVPKAVKAAIAAAEAKGGKGG